MTASNELICFPVWPLPETAMGLLYWGASKFRRGAAMQYADVRGGTAVVGAL